MQGCGPLCDRKIENELEILIGAGLVSLYTPRAVQSWTVHTSSPPAASSLAAFVSSDSFTSRRLRSCRNTIDWMKCQSFAKLLSV